MKRKRRNRREETRPMLVVGRDGSARFVRVPIDRVYGSVASQPGAGLAFGPSVGKR